jgi:hypothetical protein
VAQLYGVHSLSDVALHHCIWLLNLFCYCRWHYLLLRLESSASVLLCVRLSQLNRIEVKYGVWVVGWAGVARMEVCAGILLVLCYIVAAAMQFTRPSN